MWRPSSAPMPGSLLQVREPVLPGQDEDPAKTGALAGEHIGPDVVTDHRDLRAPQSPVATRCDVPTEPLDGDREERR